MSIQLETAQLLFKLARSKDNLGHKYDRLEHFKRFPNLKKIIKDYSKKGWILIKKKPNYTGISLDTKYKREIIELIETNMPYIKGLIR